MKQILINREEMQTRVAVVHDGVLHDFFMESTSKDRLVGSIYKGRIKNLEPSLQAAFIDIGCGKNAFLHYWDMLPATQEMLEDGDSDAEESPRQQQQRQSQKPQQPQQPQQQQPNGAVPPQGQRPPRGGRTGAMPPNSPKVMGHKAVSEPAPAKPARPLTFFERMKAFFQPKKAIDTQSSAPQQFTTKQVNRPSPQSAGQPTRPTAAKPTADGQSADGAPKANNSTRRKRPKRPSKPQPTVDDIPSLFKVDQEILVQVTKGPIGTKGARVTTNLSIPGRYLVLLPNSTHIGVSKRVEEREERDRLRKMIRSLDLPANMGLICRTVGEGRKKEHFQRDLDLLLDNWRKGEALAAKHRAPYCVYQEADLVERALRDCLTEDIDEVVVDSQDVYNRANELLERFNKKDSTRLKFYQNPTPIFIKYGLSHQLDSIFSRTVKLPSGGYICIDETEALIAIDVNTGKNRSGKDQPETILTTNLEAVAEIARQLRLRNAGGIIVLDLIDMRQKQDQQKVYKALKEQLAEDRARTKIYPLSPLGLLEMTRQREDESVESAIFDSCPYCKGSGLVKSDVSVSVEIQRRLNELLARRKPGQKITIVVHPHILERLKNEDSRVFDDLQKDSRCEFTYVSEPKMHIEAFRLLDTVSGQEL